MVTKFFQVLRILRYIEYIEQWVSALCGAGECSHRDDLHPWRARSTLDTGGDLRHQAAHPGDAQTGAGDTAT